MTSQNSSALRSSDSSSFRIAGSSRPVTASAAATCIAVGNHVVARLPAIHVVVRMRPGQTPDDLVGVHVGGRAAAGLKDVDRELIVVPALDDLFRGAFDLGPPVDFRRRALDQPQRADEAPRESAVR